MKNLYCIVGRSGTGKTTLAEELERLYGYTSISSYTTRPQRYDGETGHIFVTPNEFKALGEMSAYTLYNGFEYGATPVQIDENDLYVIDVPGVKSLKERYHGKKGIVVFGLLADEAVVRERMKKRGDSNEKITERLNRDVKAFKDVNRISDYLFDVKDVSPETLAKCVKEYIDYCEKTNVFDGGK